MAPLTVREAYTKNQLYDLMPRFIERHWPKNDTAANGGPATPGRGKAMAAIAMFIAELPEPGEPNPSALSEHPSWLGQHQPGCRGGDACACLRVRDL